MKICDKDLLWTVILNLLLLKTIYAKNCESIIKQKDVLFKQHFEKENFCFWYKMDKEYTQVNITISINIWTKNFTSNKVNIENSSIYYNYVGSNTDEYIRLSLYDIIDDIKKIQYIDKIKIVSNATMEFIKCKNCKLQSFPIIKIQISDQTPVILGVIVLITLIMSITIYIYYLKKYITGDYSMKKLFT